MRGEPPEIQRPESQTSEVHPAKSRPAGRVLWFVAFYALSLVTFTALVYLLRFIVKG